ncbi:MAG: hypothetical protein P4L33_17185 [Capsulimonadaceae bacterium]|nr:hypothetical protein [Capsulimonadaceae bacterium]
MADDDEPVKALPPAPAESGQSVDVDKCPACGRKLLTLASVLCNWCGAVIKNDDYQKRAAEERARVDAELKRQLEVEQQETAKFGILGRLKKVKREGRSAESLEDIIKEHRR